MVVLLDYVLCCLVLVGYLVRFVDLFVRWLVWQLRCGVFACWMVAVLWFAVWLLL